MLYAMQALDGGPVKIGTSVDVDGRREELERHYGRPLAILATLPGGRAEERAIHARFAHLRLGRTEQFRPDSDLMAFLGRPLLVGPNPDTVEAMPGANPLVIKGDPEWRAWVEEAAVHCRLSVSALVDIAIAKYAKSQGFDRKPPER